MSLDQIAGRSHTLKIDNVSFERVEQFRYLGKHLNEVKFYSGWSKEQTEVGECLLFGAVPSVLQFSVQKYKHEGIQNYNFAFLYVCGTWSHTLR